MLRNRSTRFAALLLARPCLAACTPPRCPLSLQVLLGNKADSSGPMVEKKAVSSERGQACAHAHARGDRTSPVILRFCLTRTHPLQALADRHGIKFFETSAKNSINVEEAFYAIARDIKARLMDCQAGGASGAVKLDQVNTGKRTGCC